jgi:hypothetical protein
VAARLVESIGVLVTTSGGDFAMSSHSGPRLAYRDTYKRLLIFQIYQTRQPSFANTCDLPPRFKAAISPPK